MRCLAIDCATSSGWALVERESRRERVLDHGALDLSGACGHPAALISQFVRQLAAVTSLEGLPVAIELPYLARGKAQNVVVLRTLARLCGRWEQAVEVYGADVELIMADHWYRCVVGNPLGRKRAERKKATKLWARGTFGLHLAEDEADAVAIAVCLLRERDTEAMLERSAAFQPVERRQTGKSFENFL